MPQPDPSPKQKPRVLIVDDSEDVINMFATLLRLEGYEVVTAPAAPAALAAARAGRFDLVIADIGMPGVSGYEMAAQLRALPEYRAVPLLAVSGFADYDDRGQALSAGFDEYLSKPVDPDVLVRTLARLLGRQPLGANSFRPDPSPSA